MKFKLSMNYLQEKKDLHTNTGTKSLFFQKDHCGLSLSYIKLC